MLSFGFDVLFQDVDIVWSRNPLDEFSSGPEQQMDLFFQYDGGSSLQQSHYANSGFVFTRNNKRTKLFWEEAYSMAHMFRTQQKLLRPLLLHHYITHGLGLHILGNEFLNVHVLPMPPEPSPKKQKAKLLRHWIIAYVSWSSNVTYKEIKLRDLGE